MPATVEMGMPLLPTLTAWHVEAAYNIPSGAPITTVASAVWPAASLAIYTPVHLPRTISVDRMFTGNGATAANSIDVGLYAADGTRLVSTGLTLQSGTSDLQLFSFAAILIGPGVFYMALSMNGTSGTFLRQNPSANFLKTYGFAQEDLSGAGTPGTLPALATFATVANAYEPLVGLVRTGFTI